MKSFRKWFYDDIRVRVTSNIIWYILSNTCTFQWDFSQKKLRIIFLYRYLIEFIEVNDKWKNMSVLVVTNHNYYFSNIDVLRQAWYDYLIDRQRNKISAWWWRSLRISPSSVSFGEEYFEISTRICQQYSKILLLSVVSLRVVSVIGKQHIRFSREVIRWFVTKHTWAK